jgi:hypothetical protein
LARKWDIMSKWSNISTRELSFQWANTIKIQLNQDGLVQSEYHHRLIVM